MTDNFFLGLNGTEAVWVVPRHADGSLSPYQWITTTQSIANLAVEGNAVSVNTAFYAVTASDGLLLVDCVAAGSVSVVIQLLGLTVAPRPIKIKKIDKNKLLSIYVETADASVIEYNASGVPYLFSNPGQCLTFDPILPLKTQYWVTS